MTGFFEPFLGFDRSVFEWVEEHLWGALGGVLDTVMAVITTLGDGGIIWIALAAVLIVFKKTRMAGLMVLGGLICSVLINDVILKPLFERPRPFNLEVWQDWFAFPNFVEKPDSLSFPSGHTSSSFASAVAMIMTKKKRIYIPALVLAVLIAFSRIYVHVHYPTDVIAGVIVGTIYGILAIIAVKLLYKYVLDKYYFPWKEERKKKNA